MWGWVTRLAELVSSRYRAELPPAPVHAALFQNPQGLQIIKLRLQPSALMFQPDRLQFVVRGLALFFFQAM